MDEKEQKPCVSVEWYICDDNKSIAIQFDQAVYGLRLNKEQILETVMKLNKAYLELLKLGDKKCGIESG